MCDGQVQTPLCEIYSRFYIPTIIQIGYILTDLLKKMQGRRFSYTPNSFILGARSLGVAAEKTTFAIAGCAGPVERRIRDAQDRSYIRLQCYRILK